MKLYALSSLAGKERGRWLLVWLPLTLALLVSGLNIYLQRVTYQVESIHVTYLNLQLKITRVDGMLDALTDSNMKSRWHEGRTVEAEREFTQSVAAMSDYERSFAPELQPLANEYDELVRREMIMYRENKANEAQLFDHAGPDTKRTQIENFLMVVHDRVRMVTTRMHTAQTVISALSIFALAGASVAVFLSIERGRRRAAEAIRRHLEQNNEELEEAVAERTKEIEYQALHDKLTGLANRSLFFDRISFALARARRTQMGTAAMFIDLDNFKLVNDSLGHSAGDELLVVVSDRLIQAVRPGDTVARLGGDEFMVLLEDLESIEQVETIASRILQTLNVPIFVQGREACAIGSIGIAYSREEGVTAEDLMKKADTAMYQAKEGGKARFIVWNAGMDDLATERLELEMALRKAVENGELGIHYQPLIDLKTGNLIGAEALARWNHPKRGPISPNQFIPIAEESGMMLSIGDWVLKHACLQATKWQAEFQVPDFIISVNLSGRQLQAADAVQRVSKILDETGIAPHCLKIEITESVFVANREESISKMQGFHALGVKLALDDFGTGYSSLSRLSAFPVDTLKIDRSFVSQLGEEEEANAVVEAIIALSKSMKMDVIGEGVETERQMSVLRNLGCQTGQGYLFARPLTVGEFSQRLLSTGRRGGHWESVTLEELDPQAA